MSTTTDSPLSARSSRALEIVGISLVITLAFHFLIAEHGFGFGLAAFIIIVAAGMTMVAALGKRSINMWAFLFLLPAVLSAASQALFANEVTRTLSFFLAVGSLSMFAFWITRPIITFKEVKCLWPLTLWLETIWPFGALGKFFSSIKVDKRLGSIVLGIIIAIPFLLIFLALFTSADSLFAKSFSQLFSSDELARTAIKLIRDIIVGLFFLSGGFMMLGRMNKPAEDKIRSTAMNLNNVALITFLVSLNVLFLIFVLFQAAYFFGGEALITAQDITYANYARNGFFELLFAAGLVFGIIWFIYRATEMKNRIVSLLNVILVVLTGVVIASAISRLLLYVDAYGLTRARWWAAACILIIGLTLFAAAMGAILNISYRAMAKTIFVMILMIASLLMVIKSDAFIAQYNVNRYLEGKTDTIDAIYLIHDLSADAVPALITLINARDVIHDVSGDMRNGTILSSLAAYNASRKDRLAQHWLGFSVSDLQAIPMIDALR